MALKQNLTKIVQIALYLILMFTTRVVTQSFQLPGNDAGTDVEDTCGNSQYATIKERLLQNYDSFEELYRLPTLVNFTSVEKYYRTPDSFFVQGSNQECAALQISANRQGGVSCPGRHIINRDVNRVPCVMKEIKCLCTHCLIPHTLQSRRHNNRCQPIYQYVPVMRRTTRLDDVNGEWENFLEPVAVGCSCAPPRQVFSAQF